MSKKTNDKKKEQLGMAPGTARNRLVKSMMFRMAKELDLLWCFQCGAEIEFEHELSIEHKEPWLDSDNPLKLYFDLDNIAFSHHSCNCSAARQPDRRDDLDKENKSKCRTCVEVKDKSDFHKRSTRWNGVDDECKVCKNSRMKRHMRKKRK